MRFPKFVMCVDMILYMKSGNQIVVDNVEVDEMSYTCGTELSKIKINQIRPREKLSVQSLILSQVEAITYSSTFSKLVLR